MAVRLELRGGTGEVKCEAMRLDQWLWAVRVYKTRTWAADAIKAAHVTVNGQASKPSREVRPGDVVVARVAEMERTLEVVDVPRSRVGAKLVPDYEKELTPAGEFTKKRERNFIPAFLRPKGAGRPTKRDRRALDGLGE